MKVRSLLGSSGFGFAMIMLALAAGGRLGGASGPDDTGSGLGGGERFVLSSTDIVENGRLPELHVLNGFGRKGGNVSPQLSWTGAPKTTKSFVVTMYDPDAPTGSGWWHWVVVNLPATVSELPRGAGSGLAVLPKGAVQVSTDFGVPGYGGAAPPSGETHRYIFTVTALEVDHIDVSASTTAAMVGFLVGRSKIAEAKLTVIYGP